MSTAVATFACLSLVIWRFTRQTPAGEPWWGMYSQYLLWVFLAMVIGAIVGIILPHRRRLAPVVAIAAVVCIMAARNYGWLRMPYAVVAIDQFPFPDLIAHEPGVMYLVVSGVVTMVGIVAGCWFLAKNHSGRSTAVTVLTAFLSGTAFLSFFQADPMVARPAPAQPVCTETARGVRYCGWPEETALIESSGPKWEEYVDSMAKLGLVLEEGTYGLVGIYPDHEVEPFGNYDGALYRSMMGAMTDTIVHKQCRESPHFPENFALADMLNTWAAFSFKNPKQPDSVGRNTPRAQWVLSHTEGKPMEEQIAVMKPIAEDLLTCGSLGRAVMS